jgi:hypothetical protein
MRLLDMHSDSEYSRFSRELPLAGFEALRHDLAFYCADFLTGPGEEFKRLAMAPRAAPGLEKGFRVMGK